MPRLGETVTEGVIVKWLKEEGRPVKKEEPIVQISTDKIETDIPSLAEGVLTKIEAEEGQKVSVGEAIGQISEQKDVGRVRRTRREKEKEEEEGVRAGFKPAREEEIEVKPLSVMRLQEAENLIKSQRESVHVTAVNEVDFTKVDELRHQHSLTFLPFLAKAVIQVLQKMPVFNAELKEKNLLFKPHVNLGIAVALPEGLIVPVIKKAEKLSIMELANAIKDVAERARGGKLKPDEVHEGTFTITNNGSFGSLIHTPVIVAGQLAILSFEAVTKRASVVDEKIVVRKKAFMPLTYDHRVIDGAQASTFLTELKNIVERADFEI
jgi:pyruvate/2-oxoglutarate dehydrogenase complex dihydrolipoamide acyltransferase (E2) component